MPKENIKFSRISVPLSDAVKLIHFLKQNFVIKGRCVDGKIEKTRRENGTAFLCSKDKNDERLLLEPVTSLKDIIVKAYGKDISIND